MKSKPTITIGIPAYNEEENIGQLIKSILDQNQKKYSLKEIIIVSDKSSDSTDKIIHSIDDERVKLVVNNERSGVALTQNTILNKFLGDILVIVNADIAIKDKNFLEKMILPIREGVDLVSPRVKPLKPNNLIGRVLYQNFRYKMSVFEKWHNVDNLYLCCGRARSFSKKFANKLRFPKIINEDVYSYLVCKQKGLRFEYQPNTTVYFQLPETATDHKNQNSRFWLTPNEMNKFFSTQFVKENLGMPYLAFRISIQFLFMNPIYYFSYLCLSLYLFFLPSTQTATLSWNSISTTKKLNIK